MKSLMKFGKRAALAALCSSLFLSSLTYALSLEQKVQELSVELPVQGITLNYSQPVRLEQVLDDANANGALGYFPLSAQLFDRNEQQQVDNLKAKVIEQLNQLAQLEPQVRAVVAQLESFDYQARYFVNLDRNAVIYQAEKNPILVSKKIMVSKDISFSKTSVLESDKSNQSQHFDLYLTQRPTDLTLVGAVKQIHKLKLIEHGQLDNYFSTLPKGELLEVADKSTAFVIQPDGHVDEISYAYWNSKQAYFAPGAIVFIAFDSLPSEFSTLNQNIIELLRHKVNL